MAKDFSYRLLLYFKGVAFEVEEDKHSTLEGYTKDSKASDISSRYCQSEHDSYIFPVSARTDNTCLMMYTTQQTNTRQISNDLLFVKAQSIYQQYQQLIAQCSLEQNKAEIEEAAVHLLAPFYGRTTGRDPWLNNLIVDRWFDYLSESCSKEGVANIHSRFKENYLKDISATGSKQEDRERLLQAKTIFWPIISTDHWHLLTIKEIDNETYSISCADGFNLHFPHYLELAEKLLRALYSNKVFDVLICNEDIPRQNNQYDCGIAICCKGQDEAAHVLQHHNYLYKRLEMAATLIDAFPTPELFLNGRNVQGRVQRTKTAGSAKLPADTEVIDVDKLPPQALYKISSKLKPCQK